MIEGGQVYLVRSDPIGRPVFAKTSAGTVVWTASYLPFGGVRAEPIHRNRVPHDSRGTTSGSIASTASLS